MAAVGVGGWMDGCRSEGVTINISIVIIVGHNKPLESNNNSNFHNPNNVTHNSILSSLLGQFSGQGQIKRCLWQRESSYMRECKLRQHLTCLVNNFQASKEYNGI